MVQNVLFLAVALTFLFFSPAVPRAETGDAAPADTVLSEKVAPEATPESALAPADEDYLIGPGDVLVISVWKDEALTRECVVRPDGYISFPLVGDIQTADKTPFQLRTELAKKLERYVPRVVLSVEVKQINSLIIYVVGKVNAPGRFIMNSNVDVLQAIATAGGLNIFAKRSKIKVFREGKNETTIFPFEYDEVVDGKRLGQNIRLKRGDVVVVP